MSIRRLVMRSLLVTLLLFLGSCAGSNTEGDRTVRAGGDSATSDCEVLVDFDDRIYFYQGTTDLELERRLGLGKMSSCSDTGPDAKGATFGNDSPTVEVWAIVDVDPDTAVGIVHDKEEQTAVAVDEDATSEDKASLTKEP
jgi:hypothetical protein